MGNLYLKEFILSKEKISSNSFYLGLFLLPSAFSVASIFLLISLVLNSFNNKNKFLNDKFNIYFLIGGFLMIVSSLIHTFRNDYLSYNLDSNISWIGLANWLPFFWCYWGFKPLLNTSNKRKISSLILLSGTLPVLVTGLGQSFFNWHGPFEVFNGLIVWYQRPIEGITGLTGLFNNPNYAGSWLNVIWPFCLSALLDKKQYLIKSISVYLFTFGISISTILTNSRSAWISLFIGILLMFGKSSFKFIISLLIIISVIITATVFPIFGEKIQYTFQGFIPNSMWMEFNDFQYSRVEIWHKGLEIIFNNPIFGTGASSFSEIFRLETGLWKGHAHNLPLELIISYGIPAGLIILIPIFSLTNNSLKIIISSKVRQASSIYDQSWVSALIVLLISQMVDVQYFDGRISIVLWVLLSGVSNIINDMKTQNIPKFNS